MCMHAKSLQTCMTFHNPSELAWRSEGGEWRRFEAWVRKKKQKYWRIQQETEGRKATDVIGITVIKEGIKDASQMTGHFKPWTIFLIEV